MDMPVEPHTTEFSVDDEVGAALDDVVDAAKTSATESRQIIERADRIRRLRARSTAWRATLEQEDRPRLVEMLSAMLNRLSAASGRLRRAQARALRNEGMSIEQVARLFGVSRQRVSMVLRSHAVEGARRPGASAAGSVRAQTGGDGAAAFDAGADAGVPPGDGADRHS